MKDAPFSFNLDRYSSAATVLELSLLARQADDRPHVALGTIKPGVAPMAIVPEDAEVVGTFKRHNGADVLAEAKDYLVYAESWASETLVTVAANSHEKASAILSALLAVHDLDAQSNEHEVGFWRSKPSGGGQRSKQAVPTRAWSAIERNYPSFVRSQLAELVSRSGVSAGEGRLILFHGEPGTGKTTAIRALIHEWTSWCDAHLITDPDRMFSDSEYLINVLQSQEGRTAPTLVEPSGEAKWKLIVAEDADTYLRSSARLDAGAALGRLLNTTDGLLGQSTKALVLLSTNEELTRLHPALIRPGRCLSRLEFVRFSRKEGVDWLGGSDTDLPNRATLAELFEVRRTGASISGSTYRTGTYL